MHIWITGGLGFIGRALSIALLAKNHRVTAVGRRADPEPIVHPAFGYISADTTRSGKWQETLQEADAVFNLAGVSIFNRWNTKNKQRIRDSRILTTRNLVEALPGDRPGLSFCSASAVGYYGNRGDDLLTEAEPPGHDFLAGIARDWEAEAFRARAKGARVIAARFGIALSPTGGALEKMLRAFKSFAGGPLGDGQQWFPWIHLDDLVSALVFALEKTVLTGPVNVCASQPVRNLDLARTLGQVLNRPAVMPAPMFVLRLALGEMADALLNSQRVVPDKLLQHGFAFKYPVLRDALQAMVR